MRRFILSAGVWTCALLAFSQTPKLSVSVSTDTVLLGNYFELKFSIENASGNGFEAPDLHAFSLVSGPNTSSSMTIINGEMSQSTSYTWYLRPDEIGVYTIKPAYLTSEDIALESPPIDIIVIPNPDGIIQQPHSASKRWDQFGPPVIKQEAETPSRPRKKF